MDALMSVNFKFMTIIPKELIHFIKSNSKYCKGIELFVDYNSKKEVNYLRELAFECRKQNFHFQVHASIGLDIVKQLKFMKLLESISDELGYKIHVVFHSIYDEDMDVSKNKTIEYMDTLLNECDLNKLTISLENLNSLHKEYRLNKEEITNIILNKEDLYFTYDIGHDILENGGIASLNDYMVKEISNIHLHTFSYDNYIGGHDHKLIFEGDEHWNELLKILTFLKINHYEGPIVYEYSLDFCIGYSIYDKIKYFISSMDYVHERLEK